MELLVIKAGDQYLRFTPEGFEITNMSKASVYPLSQKNKVSDMLNKYQKDFGNLEIKKLIITEEDYL